MSVVNAIPLIAAGDDGYFLTRSLRFRSSASAYLNRTFGTPTNNIKWTFSAWIKRGKLSGYQRIIGVGTDASGVNQGSLYFDTSAQIGFFQGDGSGSTEAYLVTNALYRDPAAWYHITFVYDSANATSANRLLMYVNGVQVTSFASATYPSSSLASKINANGVVHAIGVLPTSSTNFFDGYMAEINFIDGQALAPTAFGTFNSYGVWQPITYGGSYGTNGFRLPFTNNASTTTLGYDFSPQGNNWTTNNISVTAGSTYDSMTDVPTLTSATAANFAVLNPLDKATLASMSDGNLKLTNASAGDGGTRSTIACTDGMWYAELIVGSTTNANSAISFGLISTTVGIGAVSGYNTVNAFTLYASNLSQINNSGSITGAGSPFSAGDILQVAFDRTNNRAWVGKNNSWFDSSFGTTGNPSTAANPTFSSIPTTNPLAIFAYAYANSANANFGQRPFAYTPPSGYVALNTYNL